MPEAAARKYREKNIKEFNGKPIMVGDIIPLELSELEVQDIDNEVDRKLAELKYQLLLPGEGTGKSP